MMKDVKEVVSAVSVIVETRILEEDINAALAIYGLLKRIKAKFMSV